MTPQKNKENETDLLMTKNRIKILSNVSLYIYPFNQKVDAHQG